MNKKFVQKTILYSAVVLVLIAAIIVIVDPFSHYHMPFFGMEAVATEERSALIGVAKHDTYDTALIGSSMSENFVDSWFEDGVFGNSAVKLCFQGAHFWDYEIVLDEVIKKPEVKNIVFGLDNYLLTDNPEESEVTIPEYLYNDSIFDDAYYLWNKSVVFNYLPVFIANNKSENFSDDNAYVWTNLYEYGKDPVLVSYLPFRPQVFEERLPSDYYFEYGDEFIEKITKYIEARPDVQFSFYVPPYSALFWDYSLRKGKLEAEICVMDRVYSKLLEYDNVDLYYFQNDFDIVENINNYRDYSHFKQEINYYMYECMRDKSHRLTKDTCYDTLLAMFGYAMNTDFDSYIESR